MSKSPTLAFILSLVPGLGHINAMDGYTITSIDNPEESITYELRGTVYYEYYW